LGCLRFVRLASSRPAIWPKLAREKGIKTVRPVFRLGGGGRTAGILRKSEGRVANNVLAHVDDTYDFLSGARDLLTSDGLLVFEVPYVMALLNGLEYDTIYHEHLCYFSLMRYASCARTPDSRLFESTVCRSMVVRFGFTPAWDQNTPLQQVSSLVDAERAAGLHSAERYRKFAVDVEKSRVPAPQPGV